MNELDPKVKAKFDNFTERVVQVINIGCDAASGRYREEISMNYYSLCNYEDAFQSPIEALFYIAFDTAHKICGLSESFPIINDGPFADEENGLRIFTQYNIGPYRADFCAIRNIRDVVTPFHKTIKIAVELDGHSFHDKNEKQRRYEKKRDRYFQKQEFKVFRYTGSEIHQNPFNAAVEVLSELTWQSEDELKKSLSEYFCNQEFVGEDW